MDTTVYICKRGRWGVVDIKFWYQELKWRPYKLLTKRRDVKTAQTLWGALFLLHFNVSNQIPILTIYFSFWGCLPSFRKHKHFPPLVISRTCNKHWKRVFEKKAREDINRRVFFGALPELSGKGVRVYPCLHFWPFSRSNFSSIKGVYFFQNANVLNFEPFWTDDLVKVSWKLDAKQCQYQLTPPYFD